jgi:hypothetical protein
MAHAIHRPHLTLNSDGRRHPMENTLAVVTVLAAIVAVACAPFPRMHVLGSWAGIVGLAVGLRSQLVSATREERVITVCAMTLAGWGLLFGLHHGGLY